MVLFEQTMVERSEDIKGERGESKTCIDEPERYFFRLRNAALRPAFLIVQPPIFGPHIRQRHRHMVLIVLIVLIRQPTNKFLVLSRVDDHRHFRKFRFPGSGGSSTRAQRDKDKAAQRKAEGQKKGGRGKKKLGGDSPPSLEEAKSRDVTA